MNLILSQLNQLWGDPSIIDMSKLKKPLGKVCSDSRKLEKGNFFIPLIGDRYDGHKFLEEAFDLGAQGTVVSSKSRYEVPKGFLHWIVEDTQAAFQELARLHRRFLNAPVIAVTGSTGKTTTKELIGASLKSLGSVVTTSGNNNNDVGVPLTLLEADTSDKAIVLEMGMRGMGEIKRLSCCAEPNIAVITNIGSAHLGLLGSRIQIAKAKCEITSCLTSDGVVIIPSGDPLLEQTLQDSWHGRVIRVGLQDDQPILRSEVSSNECKLIPPPDLVGIVDLASGTIAIDGEKFNLALNGRHNARNQLLAIAVARELGIPMISLRDLDLVMPTGRSNLLEVRGITFIDETYNSSPEAVRASLDYLVSLPGRHFAVLGTMLELGEESVEIHRYLAKYLVDIGLDGLVIVSNGSEAEVMKKEAKDLSRFMVVPSPEEAVKPLNNWLRSGDYVLLKASRAISLERLIPLISGET